VAVAIMAIAVVPLLGSQSQSVSTAMISRFNTTASLLAATKITELHLVDFSALNSDQGMFEAPYEEYAYRLEVWTPSEEEVGIKNEDERLKAVELTIMVGDDERYSYSVRALIGRSGAGGQG